MLASISLTVYNRKELTQFCIETIRDRTPRNEYELIVVDNSSTKDVVTMLEQFEKKGVIDKLVLNHFNNLGSAINDAWKIASDSVEWLITLDNDNFCMKGWLENFRLVASSSFRPDVIFCQPRVPAFPFKILCKATNGGTYYQPSKKSYFGAGLAIRRKVIDKYNFKFLEGPSPFYGGSIYSRMAKQLRERNLRVTELGKPCILIQDCRFADPAYADYYKRVFNVIRKGNIKFYKNISKSESLKLRGGPTRDPEKYYEGSEYKIGKYYEETLKSIEGQKEWDRVETL